MFDCTISFQIGCMKDLRNIVKFRLDGIPLDSLDQRQIVELRKMSDRTGMPVVELISKAVNRRIEAWVAEAELPKKIVKFSVAAG